VPRTVASRAVRSYRTLSPLPDPTYAGHRRFALCCTGRRLAPPRRYLAPCPVEPGLSSPCLRKQRLSWPTQRGLYPNCQLSPAHSSASLYRAFFFSLCICAVSAAACFTGSSASRIFKVLCACSLISLAARAGSEAIISTISP
jgi:hypothetical protein